MAGNPKTVIAAGKTNFTAELVHVGEAMVGVSFVLATMLKKHSDEKSMVSYCFKVASANVSLVKMMRPPTSQNTSTGL